MKILYTANKTYRGMKEASYWVNYLPLKQLGHEVYWYDTVDPEEKDYEAIIERFKPDLIYCCMTGNHHITPYEPWEAIKKETRTGRTKTFNWFCDDTWRFHNFSKIACHSFNVCSTPEPSYIQKFKAEASYDNIIVGQWHANSDFFNVKAHADRFVDISFIGAITADRAAFFDSTDEDMHIHRSFGLGALKMFELHTISKIGLNLSVNSNDPDKKTQMKTRMFEIPGAGALMITQHHDGLEEFYDIDKEIVTFRTVEEFSEKAKNLLKNPERLEKIAAAGHKRWLAEHDSKVRLKKVLKQIGDL